ncbi:MAG: hypothetical protein OEZ23_03565, partial [Gammaproteobacteria bacterium]|nr:hypothetical protein [Gammaproteobacteria bacterium]
HHFFCGHCGINTHYFNDDTTPPHYAYNMGCVEELDTSPINVTTRINHYADIPVKGATPENTEQ